MMSNNSRDDSTDGRKAKRRRTISRDRDRIVEATHASDNNEVASRNSAFQHSLNLGFSAPPATATPAMAALRQHSILFDQTLDRGSLEYLQRLMMLSSANSLAHPALQFPGLHPHINSVSALSLLAVLQQQLPFNFSTSPHSLAFREIAHGLPPAFSRLDPLASLTISNLPSMSYASSVLGHPLVMQPSAVAATALEPHAQVLFLPTSPNFASNETHDRSDEPVSDAGDSAKSLDNASHSSSSPTIQKDRKRSKPTRTHPIESGVLLFVASDRGRLNEHQIFLRKQIEIFQATQYEILSHTRGKNKPIYLHQVGIRCRHCSHVPVGGRQKGSTYFPSNLMGIYQAAQNLGADHLQSGLCRELPPEVREQVERFSTTKPAASGAGKKYWAEVGRSLGLVDTEDGIRFADDVEKE